MLETKFQKPLDADMIKSYRLSADRLDDSPTSYRSAWYANRHLLRYARYMYSLSQQEYNVASDTDAPVAMSCAEEGRCNMSIARQAEHSANGDSRFMLSTRSPYLLDGRLGAGHEQQPDAQEA